MEQEAQTLLTTLKRSSVSADAKLAAFNNIKSNIKHLRVPDQAQPTIFECIRLAISSGQSPTLASTAFSTLGHLIKRLSLQQQNSVIVAQAKRLLPILLERLGDSRDSHRNAASQSLADFWPFAHEVVETAIKENALGGHSPRAKETAMMWVVKMKKTEGLQFKSFVPQLVACLEDGDGMVRDTAKSCIVELFKTAPDGAKLDLKKRMKAQDVRSTIYTHIVSQLDIRPTAIDAEMGASSTLGASTMSVRTMPELAHHESTFGDSVMSEAPPPQEVVPMDPMYVSTNRELEDMFRDMHTLFEGKESEHNWIARDKAVTKLRRMLKGNAPDEFHATFVAGLRSVMDGINRIANSLRTTVSSNGCLLVQELARALETALDPVGEMMIQNFIKMSAGTKKIAAENGNTTVEIILAHISYNRRLMEHMWMSLQEKNVQIRTYATGWLRTLIKKHASHKSQMEHSGGLELAEKCIKKGLADANPKVREGTRASFWAFHAVWPDHAEAIMNTLDVKSRGQLEKDCNNPNSGSMASSVSSAPSTVSKARPGVPSARQSVRDVIAAQRKAALAAKNMPDRPASAQSHFSPVKASAPSSTLSHRPAAGRAATARPPSAMSREVSQTSQASTSGSLMAAPVRRPRRPEIARPATADPYAASRRAGPSHHTPTMSPNTSPQKSKSTAKAPARTPGRAMAPTAASTIRTKSRTESAIPRKTARRSTTGTTDSPMSSPSRGDDLTMLVPFTKPPDSDEAFGAPNRRPVRLGQHAVTEADNSINEDDGFTMVTPRNTDLRPASSDGQHRIGTPKLSPAKAASASPLHASRLRTPTARSPERLRSPLPGTVTTPDVDPVQVYEDPFTGSDADTQAGAQPNENEKPVLEELPVDRTNERQPSVEDTPLFNQSTRSNEQNIDVQRTPRHHKTTSTGSIITNNESNAETLKNRRLLSSGIERIKAKTLDAHGFRRVQELVKNGQDIWGDDGQRFGELLLALLDYLEAPNESLKATLGTGFSVAKAQNLKGQVLTTIRGMLRLHRREAAPYYSRTLCSLLVSRRQWDETVHITTEIEKTSTEIIGYTNPLEALDAVLDLLEHLSSSVPTPSSDDEHHDIHRTTSFALSVLGQLFAAAKSTPVQQNMLQRLGACAVRFLQDPDSDVRKADLDFCLVMNEKLGGNGEELMKVLSGAGIKEGSVNLITYYIAKSRRGRVGVA